MAEEQEVVIYRDGAAVGTTLDRTGTPLWPGEPAAAYHPAWGDGTVMSVGHSVALPQGDTDETRT